MEKLGKFKSFLVGRKRREEGEIRIILGVRVSRWAGGECPGGDGTQGCVAHQHHQVKHHPILFFFFLLYLFILIDFAVCYYYYYFSTTLLFLNTSKKEIVGSRNLYNI